MADWALVIGASSGIGAACALQLAEDGFDIVGVHLDSRAHLSAVESVRTGIVAKGRQALFFNRNIAHVETRAHVLDALVQHASAGTNVRAIVHSVAFGVTKPLLGPQAASLEDLLVTTRVMGLDVTAWVADLLGRGLLARNGRVLAITSEGARRNWPSYGPVSAAKAALEGVMRQLALELAPHGVTANCVLAGVTETNALAKIPGHEAIVAEAKRHNPHGRLTRPEDVAKVVSLLCEERAAWITGSVVHCDGGEGIAG